MRGVLVGACCLAQLSSGYTVTRNVRADEFISAASSKAAVPLTTASSSTTRTRTNLGSPWLAALSPPPKLVSVVVEKAQELEWLEFKMLDQGFSPLDITDVTRTLERAANGDATLVAGMSEFCQLLLSLERKDVAFVTKEVLMASAIHYADALEIESVQKALYGGGGGGAVVSDHSSLHWLLPDSKEAQDDDPVMEYFDTQVTKSSSAIVLVECDEDPVFGTWKKKTDDNDNDDEVSRIVLGAARLKRAESMARTILGNPLSTQEASRLRGLLLSVMDDWRSLGIRAVACLYRLQRHLKRGHGACDEYFRSRDAIRTAREALRVYAPLAQRLGMQQLKAKIEDAAFQVLYRRQYNAASALYEHSGSSLKAMSRYLEGEIGHVLLQDEQLMSQLEDLQITSRVKEPYSAWKKLVKKKFAKPAFHLPDSSSSSSTGAMTLANANKAGRSSELSMVDIPDSVALRVILRARKYTPEEPDEVTRGRERFLCYYVQRLIQPLFPQLKNTKTKDYIQFPKDNGYQSLHYNSFLSSQGQEWPFEVQVRSEEMHRIAEYGVAAHWDYKLGSQSVEKSLPPPSESLPFEIDGKEVTLPLFMPPAEESYIDALVTAKDELVQNKVFCFFGGSVFANGEGQLLSLPVGAKVGDALKELVRNHGVPEGDICILRNGQEAAIEELVGNGDVLLIRLDS